MDKKDESSNVKLGTTAGKTTLLKSVDKALTVLSCFTHDCDSYTLNELARKLRVSKGTIHRILLTAQKNGFVEQDSESKRYYLGMKLFELGSVVAMRMDLRKQSLPYLRELCSRTQQTVFLMARIENEVTAIEKVQDNSNFGILFMDVGKRLPFHVGGGSKVLLAYMDDQEIDRYMVADYLQPWTENTTVEPEKLWDEIQQIRKNGHVLSYEDVNIGAAAVSAPILNKNSKAIAAVSVSGVSAQYYGEQLHNYIQETKAAALKISHSQGFRGNNLAYNNTLSESNLN